MVSCADTLLKVLRSVFKKGTHNRVKNRFLFPERKISDGAVIMTQSYQIILTRTMVECCQSEVFPFLVYCYLKVPLFSPFSLMYHITLKTHFLVADVSCVINFSICIVSSGFVKVLPNPDFFWYYFIVVKRYILVYISKKLKYMSWQELECIYFSQGSNSW